MSQSIFRFSPAMPPDILAIVSKLCVRYEWLIPRWVQVVYVNYVGNGNGEGNEANTTTTKPYRWALVSICGRFLLNDERERRLAILHEFLHIPTAPTIDYVENTLKSVIEEKKFQKHTLDVLSDHYEAAVQDLAERILAHEESV